MKNNLKSDLISKLVFLTDMKLKDASYWWYCMQRSILGVKLLYLDSTFWLISSLFSSKNQKPLNLHGNTLK